MEGTLKTKDPNQTLYRCDGMDFVPVQFKDIVKDDTIKFDVTDLSIYIVMSDNYTDGIDVQKVN